VRFRIQEIVSPSDRAKPASISFIDWSTTQKPGAFWLSDMEHGTVVRQSPDGAITWRRSNLSANPAVIRICDLDNNGKSDLLVTDLGSFQPADHDHGRVIWVPGFERESPELIPVLEGVGRVADVRIGDFDADGRADLVVAEFGWHRTGGIHVLFNREDKHTPTGVRFEKTTVDERPGAIHVPTADINQDGRLDFVALISQEHEVVVAFLNEPEGFRKVTLGVPNDPSNGFSGLELTDLDADGDLDVLTTNGDTFDSHLIKPYHGIAWLENQGDLQFRQRRLTSLPGVHRALAADLDGDGDLDIAAAALLPKQLLRGQSSSDFDSVIWLEQTSRGEFRRHSIERGSTTHAAMVVGDFDFDSDIDIAVGQFGNEQIPPGAAMTIFWNDGPAPAVSH
jgi:hypothetical protein